MTSWTEKLVYPLKPKNVACEPSEVRYGRRGLGRLLVVDRALRARHHSSVQALPDWFSAGDVLVLNNCKRIPGVLLGRNEEGGQVELRFTQVEGEREGICRIFPAHGVAVGGVIVLADEAQLSLAEGPIPPHGLFRVVAQGGALRSILEATGKPITSFFYRGYFSTENYNPFYSSEEGSVESPMAGLHFTPEILDAVRERGVRIAFVTLHPVGSWLPVLASAGEHHQMQRESYFVPLETADEIAAARSRESRIIACGTTVVRTLESAALEGGRVSPGEGSTDLFIEPGFRFQVVDHYFTNFHPASSSLMVLDAAFCERELLLEAYRDANENGYLFYEFGDAVLYL